MRLTYRRLVPLSGDRHFSLKLFSVYIVVGGRPWLHLPLLLRLRLLLLHRLRLLRGYCCCTGVGGAAVAAAAAADGCCCYKLHVYIDEQPEHVPRRPEGLYHLRQKRASHKPEPSNKAASDDSKLL